VAALFQCDLTRCKKSSSGESPPLSDLVANCPFAIVALELHSFGRLV